MAGILTGYFGSGTKTLEIKNDQDWGQAFALATDTDQALVSSLSLGLFRMSDASLQTITVAIRSSWDGSVLWSGQVSSRALSTNANAIYTFTNISGLNLQQGSSYVIRVTSSSTEGKVFLNSSEQDSAYAGGSLIDKAGVSLAGDLIFGIAGTLPIANEPEPEVLEPGSSSPDSLIQPPSPSSDTTIVTNPTVTPPPTSDPIVTTPIMTASSTTSLTTTKPFSIGEPTGDVPFELTADVNWGQTFTVEASGGSVSVNSIGVGIYREAGATAQTITATLRTSWNGAVLWQGTISSKELSTDPNASWVFSNISGLSLVPDKQYVLRLTSSSTNGKVFIKASEAEKSYAAGTLLGDKGVGMDGDMQFIITGTREITDGFDSGGSSLVLITPKVPTNIDQLVDGELGSAVVTKNTRSALESTSANNDSFIVVNKSFAGQDLSYLSLADGYMLNVNFSKADLSYVVWEDINNYIPSNIDTVDTTSPGFKKDEYLSRVDWGLNFRGANLSGARFTDLYMSGSDFRPISGIRTKLNSAIFDDSYLAGSKFNNVVATDGSYNDADLFGASFVGANLSRSSFVSADLTEANMTRALLNACDFTEAALIRSNLTEAKLKNAILDKSDLSDVNLQNADLEGASLRTVFLNGSNLSGAILNGVDASGSVFAGANLRYTSLREASLLEADFRYANLAGADLSFADLSKADFTGAFLGVGADRVNLTGATLVDTVGLDANTSASLFAGLINPPPVESSSASFEIEGTPKVGEVLVAKLLSSDPEGDGAFKYKWERSSNGSLWQAIASTEDYVITSLDEGSLIRLRVTYKDGNGTNELVSTASVKVGQSGSASFEIEGTPVVGETLVAKLLSSDPDGDNVFTYKWQRSSNGSPWQVIGSAEEYTLTALDEASTIRLRVSYRDQAGNDEIVMTTPVTVDSGVVEPPVEPVLGFKPPKPNNDGTFFPGADLRNQLIEKAEVVGVNATGILLSGAILKGCFFYNVDFTKAKLRGTVLEGFNTEAPLTASPITSFRNFKLNFRGSDLSFVQAGKANLAGADFRNHADGTLTNLRGAQFAEANLSKSNFTDVLARGINLAKANLAMASLGGVVLSGSDLSGTDLSNADLSNANLAGVNLSYAILSNANLGGANLEGAILDGAILTGASLNGANLTRASLIGALVLNADLEGASLVNANLTKGDYTGSNFGTGLTKTDITGAVTVDAIGLDSILFGVDETLTNQYLSNISVSNLDATRMNLTGTVIDASFLYNINFSSANFSGTVLTGLNNSTPSGLFTVPPTDFGLNFTNANFSRAVVIGGNLSGSSFAGATLQGTIFSGTNLTDVDFSGIIGTNLILQQVTLLGANLSNASLQNADFFELSLSDTNFAGANLMGANFVGANLVGANFRGANLEDADFTAADISGADFTGANLQGITFIEGKALGSNFTSADLSLSNLTGSDFTGSNFGNGPTKTILTDANTSGAIGIEASQVGRGADASDTIFENLVVIDTNLRSINLEGSTVIGGFLYNVNFVKANLSRALLSGINGSLPSGSTFVVNPTNFDLDFRGADLSYAVFEGANLAGSNFTKTTDNKVTNLTGIRFIDVILSGSDFAGANLGGANLSELDLTGINFAGTDLRGANLSNALLTNADLSGALLDDAILDGAILDGALLVGASLDRASFRLGSALSSDFESASLVNSDLTGSVFTGSYFGYGSTAADMRGAIVRGAEGYPGAPIDPPNVVIPEPPSEPTTPDGRFVSNADLSDGSYSNIFVVNTNASGIDLSNSSLIGVYFEGVNFTGGNLSNTYFSELNATRPQAVRGPEPTVYGLDFTNANLANAIFSGGILNGSNFENANLSGLRFLGSELKNSNFKGIRANEVVFRESILVKSVFDNALLEAADLSNADLTGVSLRGVNLRGANLAGAILNRTDLTGADLTGANLYETSLRGANVTGAQFDNAVLVGSDFTNAAGIGTADFTGANVYGAIGVPGADPELPTGPLVSDSRFVANADLSSQSFAEIYVANANATGINLSNSNLFTAYLQNVDFTGGNFAGAVFTSLNAELPLGSSLVELPTRFNLDFSGATLRNTLFLESNLAGSSFANTALTSARFLLTDLTNVNFSGARASGAIFQEAILQGSNFRGVSMAGALLAGADLTGVDFTDADLSGTDLTGAILTNANLTRAKLIGATLIEADLRRANLLNANFTNANLYAADLTNATNAKTASYSGANLTETIGPNGQPLLETNTTLNGQATFETTGLIGDTAYGGEMLGILRKFNDPQGNGNGLFDVFWETSSDNLTWIEVATDVPTYTPGEDQIGKNLRARIQYTDTTKNQETVILNLGIIKLRLIDNGNATFTIVGSPSVGIPLSASLTKADEDGSPIAYTYIWEASTNGSVWTVAPNNTGTESYVPNNNDEDKMLRVRIKYTDNEGHDEEVITAPVVVPATNEKAATIAIGGLNDGKASVGSTLTANILEDDPDLGIDANTQTYKWQTSTPGLGWSTVATSSSFSVRPIDEGKLVRLITNYSDLQGFTEEVTTDPANIGFFDDGDAGFTVTGTVAVGQVLTAKNTIADLDGNGTFGYTWQTSTDGVSWTKVGASKSKYKITTADQGKQVRVQVKYTDTQGFDETIIASAGTVPSLPPTLSSVAVSDSIVLLTFSSAIAPNSVDPSALRVETVTGQTVVQQSITSITFSDNNKLVIQLATAPTLGMNVRVSYTDQIGDQTIGVIQGTSGIDVAAFENVFAKNLSSSLSVTSLASQYRMLTLTGTSSINGRGNPSDNQIKGNSKNNILTGLAGNDLIIGNGGNDTLTGGLGADTLTGGLGADVFTFVLADSLLSAFDRITDLLIGTDSIDAPTPVTAQNLLEMGAVASLTSTSIQSLLTAASFTASQAATFSYNDPNIGQRTFLALNDNTAGFNELTDGIIEITGFQGTLTNLSVI